MVALKGGQCERCLGCFHPSVFVFHHAGHTEKHFGLNKSVMTNDVSVLMKELEKCHLLCSNCHAEVHAFRDLRYLK